MLVLKSLIELIENWFLVSVRFLRRSLNLYHGESNRQGVFVKKLIFFLGNRFSGETLVADILNLHPDVQVVTGSCNAWLLWRAYAFGDELEYHFDDPAAFRETTSRFRPLASSQEIPAAEAWPLEGRITGEAAPQQTHQPLLEWFRREVCQNVQLIHCIRHPLTHAMAISSKLRRVLVEQEFDQGTIFPGAHGNTFKAWMTFETIALACEQVCPSVWVRYEDLAESPAKHAGRVFKRLGLDAPSSSAIEERYTRSLLDLGEDVQPLSEAELPGPIREFAKTFNYFGPCVGAPPVSHL